MDAAYWLLKGRARARFFRELWVASPQLDM
jgi:hypothetical protein